MSVVGEYRQNEVFFLLIRILASSKNKWKKGSWPQRKIAFIIQGLLALFTGFLITTSWLIYYYKTDAYDRAIVSFFDPFCTASFFFLNKWMERRIHVRKNGRMHYQKTKRVNYSLAVKRKLLSKNCLLFNEICSSFLCILWIVWYAFLHMAIFFYKSHILGKSDSLHVKQFVCRHVTDAAKKCLFLKKRIFLRVDRRI